MRSEPQGTSITWHKSSYSSGTGNCVEVAGLGRVVAIRDSKNPSGGQLAVSAPTWSAFLASLRG